MHSFLFAVQGLVEDEAGEAMADMARRRVADATKSD